MSDTPILKSAPTLAVLRARRDEIIAAAQRNKAFDVRVFGSVARGDATPESDVDFLVTFEKGASIFDQVGLWQDLSELLGCEVDVVADHPELRERFRQYITPDLVAL